MNFAEEEMTRLFRIHKTLLQMLRDRGYLIADFEFDLTRADFIGKYGERMKREDLEMQRGLCNNSSDKIFIFFPNDSKIGVHTIRSCIGRMRQENVLRAILIVQKKLQAQARGCINAASSIFHIEVFEELELLFNITEHELVPKHQLLTNEEKKALLQRYTVKESQLPRILVSDPIARYYGLRRGQVVKITRKSETAGNYVTYRYVV